jgi:hypothetical protein
LDNHHVHLHIIVTAGGLLLCGSAWVVFGAEDEAFSKASLGACFRDLYLAGLLRLYRRGKLSLPDSLAWIQTEADFCRWLAALATIDWHAHCQGPPRNRVGWVKQTALWWTVGRRPTLLQAGGRTNFVGLRRPTT